STIVFAGLGWETRLIVILSRAGCHLRSGIINGLMRNRQNELIRSLRRQLEAKERELENQKWVFEQFMKSPAWRLTYPIRWLAKQFRALRDWLLGRQQVPEATASVEVAEIDDNEIEETPLELKQFFTGLYRIQLQGFLTTGKPLELPQSASPEISII